MATLPLLTTPEEDDALAFGAARYNAQSGTAAETPTEFLLRQIRHIIRFHLREYRHARRTEDALLLQAARVDPTLSPEDRATLTRIIEAQRTKQART